MGTYTSAEAAKLTNVSPTQIDHVVRLGLVVPEKEAPRRGMPRLFGFNNLVEITVAVKLSEIGVAPVNSAVVMRYLNKSWWLLVREPKARKMPRSESAVLWISFAMGMVTAISHPRRVEVGLRSINAIQKYMEQGMGGCAIPMLAAVEALESKTGDTIIDPSGEPTVDRGTRASWMTDAQFDDWVEVTRALDASHQASREWISPGGPFHHDERDGVIRPLKLANQKKKSKK
jgi:hypothetical protein